jgi:tRNA U34 2-thiouridine synthase MnmA/TrmU
MSRASRIEVTQIYFTSDLRRDQLFVGLFSLGEVEKLTIRKS